MNSLHCASFGEASSLLQTHILINGSHLQRSPIQTHSLVLTDSAYTGCAEQNMCIESIHFYTMFVYPHARCITQAHISASSNNKNVNGLCWADFLAEL